MGLNSVEILGDLHVCTFSEVMGKSLIGEEELEAGSSENPCAIWLQRGQ